MKKSYIVTMKHADGMFSGLEQRFYPTPSGCDRWIDGLEDKRKFETPEMAKVEMRKELSALKSKSECPELLKLRISDIDGVQ